MTEPTTTWTDDDVDALATLMHAQLAASAEDRAAALALGEGKAQAADVLAATQKKAADALAAIQKQNADAVDQVTTANAAAVGVLQQVADAKHARAVDVAASVSAKLQAMGFGAKAASQQTHETGARDQTAAW